MKASNKFKELVSLKTKEAMKNVILPQTGKKRTKEVKLKISKANKGRNSHRKGVSVFDEYGIKKGSELIERNRETTISQLKNGRMPNKETMIEAMFKEVLISNSIDFEEQKQFKLGIADFYLPEYKTFVFCDGDYWHNYPNGKSRDSKQVEYLESEGFKAYRFWERDIKTDVKRCLSSIV